MSTFRGGPADGVTLMFARGPLYLRVVIDRTEGFNVDVLDQVDDRPRPGEDVHVYRRVGPNRSAHLNYRGSKHGRSGWYEFSDYEHVETTEEERTWIRDTSAWQAWARERTEA